MIIPSLMRVARQSRRGADRQQVDEYDVLAVLGQQLVQALNVSDAPGRPGAFEDTTGVELALERSGQRPCTTASARDEQVAIGGVVHQIDRSGTRRPPSNLAEHRLTIGFAVPLHVGEPVRKPSAGNTSPPI